MFSLIKGLWKKYTEKPTYRLLILGLNGAGKTTFITKIKEIAK
jgi:ADP-ribosylation factor related protein 1